MKTLRFACLFLAAAGFAAATLSASAASTRDLKIIQPVDVPVNLGVANDVPDRGEVTLVLMVDAEGKLEDALVTRYTHQAYANAALDAVAAFRYEPAWIDGAPANVRTMVKLQFEARGRVINALASETVSTFVRSMLENRTINRVARPEDLDQPLAIQQSAEPKFPGMLEDGTVQATSVMLDFYVDEAGRPRMPVVVSASHVAYAAAAMEALEQWRFSRPTVRGEPVIVRVQQEFVFTNIGRPTS